MTRLERMVIEGLNDFGWFRFHDGWMHEVLDFSFSAGDQNGKSWKQVSHYLRQSIRWKSYCGLATSQRHELEGPLPEFNEARLDLVRKFAASSGVAFSFVIGAKMTPYLMKPSRRSPAPRCPVCSETYWLCGMGLPPPRDVLLRRFLWPRDQQDLQLCQKFITLPTLMQPVQVNAQMS